jgi:hypothetical protein
VRVVWYLRAHTNEVSGLCFTLSSQVLHKIIQSIFQTIVEQAPLAIEDIMNELDTQSGEGEASDGDDGEASDGDDGEASDDDDGEASDGGDGDVADSDDSDGADDDDGDVSDGDGGDNDEGDSNKSSEGEQDLQDTPPKKLPAGEGPSLSYPRLLLDCCSCLWAVLWRAPCCMHEGHLVCSPKSVSALDSWLPASSSVPRMLLPKVLVLPGSCVVP